MLLGLADIEHLALGVDHAIDAGRRRRVLDRARNRGAAGAERAGRLLVELELGQAQFLVLLAEVAGRIDIGLGAVVGAVHGGQIIARRARRHSK